LKALILQRRVFGRLPQLDLGQTLGLGEGSRREDDREAIGRELVPRRRIGFRDREVARARTFGFLRDVTTLWNSGYALGASLEKLADDVRVEDAAGGEHLLFRISER